MKSGPTSTASRGEFTPAPRLSGLPSFSSAWLRIGLVVLTVLCLAPFLGKAIHIDDPLFVWAAKHIVKHPFDPYGFSIVWNNTSMPMYDVNWNPPLTAYYAALTGVWLGWSEFSLHVAFMVPAVIVVLAVYQLGRGLCDSPALAAALTLAAPGFLVSSTSLMSDVPMLALWMVAVVAWREGLEKESHARLAASAVLMAACALTKYFGACLIPLLLLYSIWKKRGLGLWALYFLVPVCILVGYQLWTQALYGHDSLSYAAVSADQARGLHSPAFLAKALVGLSFLGGCAVPALAFAPWLWQRRGILAGLAFSSVSSAAVALGWMNAGPFPREHQWFLAFQFALFIAGGLSALALAWCDFWRRREADSVLLLAWILGTFIFVAFVNWSINVRYLLPLVPPVGILIVRALGSNPKRGPLTWILAVPSIASLLLSLWVAWGDMKLANSAREAAEVIYRKTGSQTGKVLFQGHWGFQYYMESLGAMPLDLSQSNLSTSDTIVEPDNNANVTAFSPMMIASSFPVAIDTGQWVATLQRDRSAGFYTSFWGALPFAFGSVPEEKYKLIHPSPLAGALYRKGEIDKTIGQIREAIRLKPDDADARKNLGAALFNEGKVDEAISQFQDAMRLKPGNAEAHDYLGVAFLSKGQIDDAISQFQDALRLKPDDATIHFNLGAILANIGQTDEGICQFQEAIRLKPDYVNAHKSLGNALVAKGQMDEAIRQFQETIRLKPADAEAHNNLGSALLKKGQTDEAIRQFQEAIRFKADYAEAHNNLAWIRAANAEARFRDGPEAVRLAEWACQLSQYKQPVIVETLAAAFAEAGRFDEAVAAAEKARVLALSLGQKEVANKNMDLLQLYKARKPFHEGETTGH